MLVKHEVMLRNLTQFDPNNLMSNVYVCVPLLTGKVLPGLVGLTKVGGSFQNPEVWTGRVSELYQHIGHVKELWKQDKDKFTLNIFTYLPLFALSMRKIRHKKEYYNVA